MLRKVKLSKINGIPTNNIYADFHFLSEENFADIISLYDIVTSNMDNKNWLKVRTFENLQKTIDNGGFIIGCYVDSELIACALCDSPDVSSIDLLSGLNIDPTDIENTYISGFVMVHPKYRGNSLQLTLLDLRIDIARNRGKRYIVTVVAVDNIYSLKNIESLGFKRKSQKTNEFGILRNIFVKDLVEDMVCESVVTA